MQNFGRKSLALCVDSDFNYGDLEEGMKNRKKISNQGMNGASEAGRKG